MTDGHFIRTRHYCVGKSEQRELESRMAMLLAHLLKWQFQPEGKKSVGHLSTLADMMFTL